MFVIANLLFAVAQVLDYVLWAYIWIIIARVVVSLVKADTTIPAVRFLYSATEPVFQRLRQRWPVVYNGYDLSPIIVWIAAVFLQRFLVRTLYDLANTLR
ncbi:MAG TPA: YggT family protein [Candidatus Binatus sp.]|nr:YggT family protein [Candidatus Binatus sp.]